jgi:hypothetical protein
MSCGDVVMTDKGEAMTEALVRPIIGIENRTAQEVFDIMSDRIRSALEPAPSAAEIREAALEEAAKQQEGMANAYQSEASTASDYAASGPIYRAFTEKANLYRRAAQAIRALKTTTPDPTSAAPPSREEGLREALTPSAATKAAYLGEFKITLHRTDEAGDEYTEDVMVPWTTIKEIMAAILARALSHANGGE